MSHLATTPVPLDRDIATRRIAEAFYTQLTGDATSPDRTPEKMLHVMGLIYTPDDRWALAQHLAEETMRSLDDLHAELTSGLDTEPA